MPPRSRARLGLLALACAALLGCEGAQSTGGPAIPTATAALPPSPSAAPTTAPTTDETVRIPLSGAAPDALVLDGSTAWVLTGEGGTLLEVDLEVGIAR